MVLTGPRHGLREGSPAVFPALPGEAPPAQSHAHLERPELRGAPVDCNSKR